MGVASKADRFQSVTPFPSSPVWKVHATCSRPTFAGDICVSGEYRVPPGSPPYVGQPASVDPAGGAAAEAPDGALAEQAARARMVRRPAAIMVEALLMG
jgi:hypothetical protein